MRPYFLVGLIFAWISGYKWAEWRGSQAFGFAYLAFYAMSISLRKEK